MKKKYQVISALSMLVFMIGLANGQNQTVVDDNGNLKVVPNTSQSSVSPDTTPINPITPATPTAPATTPAPPMTTTPPPATTSPTTPPPAAAPAAPPEAAPNTMPTQQPVTPPATTINQSL
jgi:hypothetical protein